MSDIRIKRIEVEPDPDRIMRPREVVTTYEVNVTLRVSAESHAEAVALVQGRLEVADE